MNVLKSSSTGKQCQQLTFKLFNNYSKPPIHKKVAFDVLGLQSNAHPLEIKEAYLKLSKKFHPDVSSLSNSTEMFKHINEAYRLLKNECKGDDEIFSSGVNKNPKYNFEDKTTDEDYEVYKRYTSQNNGAETDFSYRGLDSKITHSVSNIKASNAFIDLKKHRGSDHHSMKSRMEKIFKS